MTNEEVALETQVAQALGLAPIDPARDLCRSLIQAEPTSPYREVQATAERLGLAVSRALFSAVQREIAGTARGADLPERGSTPETAPTDPAVQEMRRGTSALDFIVGHLTTHPAANYGEVRSAATAAGHAVVPITYGRARKLAGLPSRSKPGQPGIDGKRAPNPAIAYMVEILRTHPDSTYRELKAAAASAGHQVFPATFGNARHLAGLERRLPKRAVKKSLTAPAPVPTPPSAVTEIRRSTSSSAQDAISVFVELTARLERNRGILSEALGKVSKIARECLDRLE